MMRLGSRSKKGFRLPGINWIYASSISEYRRKDMVMTDRRVYIGEPTTAAAKDNIDTVILYIHGV